MADISNIKGNGHNTYDSSGNWTGWVEDSPDNTVLTGTVEDDYIRNEGVNVKIYASGGRDNIDNESSQVTIYAGDGADVVYNSGNNVQIYGEAGNDSIKNQNGGDVTISGGDGNNTLKYIK